MHHRVPNQLEMNEAAKGNNKREKSNDQVLNHWPARSGQPSDSWGL
jgi:hypothetical protein